MSTGIPGPAFILFFPAQFSDDHNRTILQNAGCTAVQQRGRRVCVSVCLLTCVSGPQVRSATSGDDRVMNPETGAARAVSIHVRTRVCTHNRSGKTRGGRRGESTSESGALPGSGCVTIDVVDSAQGRRGAGAAKTWGTLGHTS